MKKYCVHVSQIFGRAEKKIKFNAIVWTLCLLSKVTENWDYYDKYEVTLVFIRF